MLKTELLPFQKDAFEKLKALKVGALYMEMGLGKTRTSLSLIQYRLDKNKIDSVLWLCPCSTKKNVEEQIKEHSDLLPKIKILGIESISMSEKSYLEAYDEVTSSRCMLVVDESNLVKNPNAIRSKRILKISKNCTYKIILNGTPVTRNEADLYSQWNILDWRILGYRSFYSFSANHLVWDKEHRRIVRTFDVEYLTNRIAPYCYQAKKDEVLKLPNKLSETYYFDITEEQFNEYYRVKENILYFIESEETQVYWIYKLFTALQLVTSGNKITSFEPLKHEKLISDELNPRILAFKQVVEQLPVDSKSIIWCKYTDEIKRLEKLLKEQHGEESVALYYGEISLKQRNEEIEKFKNKARFLIGNKNSGGYGLNLQFANYMIFYSNDFDWGTRAQAEDRIHRIGQNKDVIYIDIVARHTIDSRIMNNLDRKMSLSNEIKYLLKKKRDIRKWLDGEDKCVEVDRKNLKVNLDMNVLEAAKKRIEFIFDEFERVCLSFSGGKDSGVCLNMMIDEARKRGRKFGVLHIDVEAEYQMTTEFIKRIIENNLDVIEPFWVCLPMESNNSLSFLEPTWIWWDKEKEPIWVRKMPKMDYVINEDNNPIDFYTKNMPFEEFVKHFAQWYGKGGKVANVVGLRTQESLNRFRAICNGKYWYKRRKYSTKLDDNTFNFYPIYDWDVRDIWTYNGKYQKDYNRLYDLFYKAGVSIHQMRVDEPFGNEAKAGLSLFKVIEPQTWYRVVNRVSGANFGNIYHGTKIMKANYTLPKNHTWKSFTKFLLGTLPGETRAHYLNKFIKFIKYWNKKGCPVPDDMIELLNDKYSDYVDITGEISNRGSKDKVVVKFKKILDEAPEIGSSKQFLTWKRMAMCIIKNDFLCKGLCFGTTKDLTIRQKDIIERYKKI